MLYQNARFAASPNFGSRLGNEVECVVIHHISLPPGEFGGPHVEELFLNRLNPAANPYFAGVADLRVSAHFFIDRAGAVTQFVDTKNAAWHAGVSSWNGREGVNLFSVGIELEGDETTPYEDAQYRRLAELVAWLMAAHPAVGIDSLTGHEQIAPGRKRDPGPHFDWARLKNDVRALTRAKASA